MGRADGLMNGGCVRLRAVVIVFFQLVGGCMRLCFVFCVMLPAYADLSVVVWG
jgi:hypothetical protein